MSESCEMNVETAVSDIVCAITQGKADLFVRNNTNRLVPLSDTIFRRLQQALKRMKDTNNDVSYKAWAYGDLIPISYGDGLIEYESQTPNTQEQKRRDKVQLFKELCIERLIWSSTGPISDEAIPSYLDAGKDIKDYIVSRMNHYPGQNIHTVIISNKSLSEEVIKNIWDSYLTFPKSKTV